MPRGAIAFLALLLSPVQLQAQAGDAETAAALKFERRVNHLVDSLSVSRLIRYLPPAAAAGKFAKRTCVLWGAKVDVRKTQSLLAPLEGQVQLTLDQVFNGLHDDSLSAQRSSGGESRPRFRISLTYRLRSQDPSWRLQKGTIAFDRPLTRTEQHIYGTGQERVLWNPTSLGDTMAVREYGDCFPDAAWREIYAR